MRNPKLPYLWRLVTHEFDVSLYDSEANELELTLTLNLFLICDRYL